MLTFYHAPWSRSSSVFWLLEELGVEYKLEIVDIRGEGGAPEAYRAIQPNKKVPAIDHDGRIVTERAAITIYLCDTFPEAALAPAISDPMRAAYLKWLVYADAVFDPAVSARVHGLDYVSNDYSFGLFDDMVRHVEEHLTTNAFMCGDRFTAADVQMGSAIGYTMEVLKVLPERDAFKAYMSRIEARPAAKRADEKDRVLAMELPFFKAQFGGEAAG
ncbi:glutathione S-transferase family protein [Nitratireductor mangrovi]|uniref:Glutathione S-transferase family protein n=1 Tax=Nitratireductor mangrovi TaxID=2599600 RepID=A0A5B8L3Z3_9HYPH|nr:glutathione S-transferase family protein [Nitratireductor mangrovi]QDZ02390.1 glutathione S-transferase family protein [Nitratireductor mangrovi]